MIVHDGIKVKIFVDETEIPEYLVEKDLVQRKITCWIPSQIGKGFAIMFTNERQDECSVTVKADGTTTDDTIMKCATTRNVAFYCESQSVKRPFIFAKLDLVDDDDLLDTAEAHLGEIELVCWNFERLETRDDPNYKRTFPENKKVHERSKKGVGQHIGLGRVISSQVQFVDIKRTDRVVTFVFRYRPIDYLQAQGIAPLDPPQLGATSGADAALDERGPRPGGSVLDGRQPKVAVKEEYVEISEDEDDAEIWALLAKAERMRAKAEEKRAQKRKKKVVQVPRKKVKKEKSPPAFVPGQIIDLT